MDLRLHREVEDAAGSLSLLTNDRFSSGKETGGDKKKKKKKKLQKVEWAWRGVWLQLSVHWQDCLQAIPGKKEGFTMSFDNHFILQGLQFQANSVINYDVLWERTTLSNSYGFKYLWYSHVEVFNKKLQDLWYQENEAGTCGREA